jgi:enoyl-CoA hydratase/carnithine racemase
MNTLTITRHKGIASVAIGNPPANVLTTQLIDEINAFVLSLKGDSETKVVVFRSSNEKFFLAHLDLNAINGSAHGRAACNEFSQMIDSIKAMRQLSILKHGGQTEREATDFSGLFADTASALAQ